MAADASAVLRDILRPIQGLLARDDLTDLCLNGPGAVYAETAAGWECLSIEGITETWLFTFARALASFMNATVSERQPLLSGHLPSGERVQIVLPPAAEAPSITIRRPARTTFSLTDLDALGTFAPVADAEVGHQRATLRNRLAGGPPGAVPDLLRAIVRHRLNVVIAGATGSGKTTLSKAMIAEIPRAERLIAIEDARELVFPQPNVVRLYYARDGAGISPVSVRELLVACLRMKPDRILLAELRDAEAYDYLRNVNSGHPGSITTVHANSAAGAVEQLMLMVRQSTAGAGLTGADIRGLVTSLVDVVIQMARRRVTEILFLPDGAVC